MNLSEYIAFITEDIDNIRVFHISNNIIKILQPKIPNNFYTKMGWEDGKIKRISVAPDIDHCILSIGNNKVAENPKIYRVYEPIDYDKIKVMTNQELIRRNLVPDAKQTKEFWLLSTTRVKEIAKIKVLKMNEKYVTVPYGPEGKQTPARNRRAYFWDWKLIEGTI